jgi:alkanesulfonate monooxygenase SsuD/methylene tetrahydromethanopterin reductase-like flavin-dependent oxidoreductase (luciferase family)
LRQTWSIGTPEQIRERLVEYEEAGIQELIVRFVDAAQLESVRLFARIVYNDANKSSVNI